MIHNIRNHRPNEILQKQEQTTKNNNKKRFYNEVHLLTTTPTKYQRNVFNSTKQ